MLVLTAKWLRFDPLICRSWKFLQSGMSTACVIVIKSLFPIIQNIENKHDKDVNVAFPLRSAIIFDFDVTSWDWSSALKTMSITKTIWVLFICIEPLGLFFQYRSRFVFIVIEMIAKINVAKTCTCHKINRIGMWTTTRQISKQKTQRVN